ncbi:MAG TPA: hydrogenase maturation nickel metallochaperone HypA [Methylocella sp.]|nr:hydrogenase maturation nickel metallochaperone HypA [Methylocella sp.]
MHELAITCNIVELAEEAANGRRVHRVTIEIGELSGVLPDAITFCFPEVANGTCLQDAFLEIRRIDALARCSGCGSEFRTPEITTVCPCGSLDFVRLSGEELNIKSIELEEAA